MNNVSQILLYVEVGSVVFFLWRLLVLGLDTRDAHKFCKNLMDDLKKLNDRLERLLGASNVDWEQEKVQIRRDLTPECRHVFEAVLGAVAASDSVAQAKGILAKNDFSRLSSLVLRAESWKETLPVAGIVGTGIHLIFAIASMPHEGGQGAFGAYMAEVKHGIAVNCTACCLVVLFSWIYYHNQTMDKRVAESVSTLTETLYRIIKQWRKHETANEQGEQRLELEALLRHKLQSFRGVTRNDALGAADGAGPRLSAAA